MCTYYYVAEENRFDYSFLGISTSTKVWNVMDDSHHVHSTVYSVVVGVGFAEAVFHMEERN